MPRPIIEALPRAVLAGAFREALAAAESFAGATAPNPPVGCVLLDAEGQVLACEAHQRAGEQHAEAAAIAACRSDGLAERIHTVIVTLEPCNHTGRTPPCTDAILATPAQAVWMGARDPNPSVTGGGAGRLGAAGRMVRFAEDLDADIAQAARRLIAPFRKSSLTGRPWLTVKQALTTDGSMIPPPGRKTFTDEAALDHAHRLRRRADAILTGSGCILADDPAFTVRRVADHSGKRRILAILDRRGRIPKSYVEAARRRGFDVRIRTNLDRALRELGEVGVLEVLVEAGPTLHAAIVASDLWDEHVRIRQRLRQADLIETRTRQPV